MADVPLGPESGEMPEQLSPSPSLSSQSVSTAANRTPTGCAGSAEPGIEGRRNFVVEAEARFRGRSTPPPSGWPWCPSMAASFRSTPPSV